MSGVSMANQQNTQELKPIDRSLVKKVFHYKKPHMSFYCPLCATPRSLSVRAHMGHWNHLQLSVATAFIAYLLSPLMEWRGLYLYFFFWAIWEGTLRLLRRKEVPCPHCGFDASWYKRDVKEARRRVEEFWKDKTQPKSL